MENAFKVLDELHQIQEALGDLYRMNIELPEERSFPGMACMGYINNHLGEAIEALGKCLHDSEKGVKG